MSISIENIPTYAIDIELTFAQFKSDSYSVLDHTYILKGGKKVKLEEFRQFKGVAIFPYYEIFRGLLHKALAYKTYCRDFDVDAVLPFYDRHTFESCLTNLRKEFEQKTISIYKAQGSETKGAVFSFMRYLAENRTRPIAIVALEIEYHWMLESDYVDDFLRQNAIALATQLDDFMVSMLSFGDNYWIALYTLCKHFETKVLEATIDEPSSTNNDYKLKELGRNTDKNLKKARGESVKIRSSKRTRDEKSRLKFAEKKLNVNPTLTAKDLARKYHETSDVKQFTLSTLETYFQTTKRQWLRNMTSHNR